MKKFGFSFNKLLMTLLFAFGSMGLGIVGDEGGGGASDSGTGDDSAGGAAKPAPDDASKGNEGEQQRKPSDGEAKLIKEVMQKKEALKKTESDLQAAQERLKQFDGIDPEAVRKLLNDQKAAETAQLEAKGEWDRLKQRMAEEHTAQTKALEQKLADAQAQLEGRNKAINELTIGTQFGQSSFIAQELVIPPAKARVVYGDHFDLVDGKVVGYDKPRGASNRTALVDQTGEPIPFDTALRKIVEADPDKDHLLKSKLRPGANSESRRVDTKAANKADEGDALSKIANGLKGLNLGPSAGIAS